MMANDSRKKRARTQALSESERSTFYSWAEEQGFTRLNMSGEDFAEELWFDPHGKIMSADRIVREHPDWKPSISARPPDSKAAPSPRTALSQVEWLRLLPTVALAIVLVGAYQSAATWSREPAPAESNDRTNLGLTVNSLANLLEIRWNRESRAILASAGGTMKITENGVTETVPIDPAQLRDGYVAYGPKTNDVSIRLEVTGRHGDRTSESVRSVAIP
ncbi:MAG TPA: hypothetical protein VFW44_06860 [Bryobacteraceae bacterium]|nr:hypothetical protein [Bryobacteraceae bacterium]